MKSIISSRPLFRYFGSNLNSNLETTSCITLYDYNDKLMMKLILLSIIITLSVDVRRVDYMHKSCFLNREVYVSLTELNLGHNQLQGSTLQYICISTNKEVIDFKRYVVVIFMNGMWVVQHQHLNVLFPFHFMILLDVLSECLVGNIAATSMCIPYFHQQDALLKTRFMFKNVDKGTRLEGCIFSSLRRKYHNLYLSQFTFYCNVINASNPEMMTFHYTTISDDDNMIFYSSSFGHN